MGRSFRGRRSRAGSPTQSAAERRAALAEHDDLADADSAVRELSRRVSADEPPFDPRHYRDTGTADIAP